MNNKATERKITITWGLPGSGKTTFTEKIGGNYRYNRSSSTFILSFDEYTRDDKNASFKIKRFTDRINGAINSRGVEHILVDTLITTNDGFINLVKNINILDITVLDIQYWEPDIMSCLWNDRYRRSVNSEITIKNIPFEKPDIKLIKNSCSNLENVSISVKTNNVVRKKDWEMFADKFNIRHTNGVVKSETWSLGGTSGNCWDSTLHQISGDSPLASFVEFDDLMEAVCPNMTFLQFKKLFNSCVRTDTTSEGDYYGGCVTYAFYEYNVSKLYSELIDLNLINLKEEHEENIN